MATSADINEVALAGTDYADNATIEGQWNGNGGSFDITGGRVVYQLQYPPPKPETQRQSSGFGDAAWSDEHQLGTGPGTIPARVTGIRFRNVDAANPATVTAAIAAPGQPILAVSAPGTVAAASSSMIEGIVAGNGAVTAGSGFSVVRTGAGAYTVTFTSPFAATPYVDVNPLVTGTNTAGNWSWSALPTATGFAIKLGVFVDNPWQFVAIAVT